MHPNMASRREALEKLWDAWERLKSLENPANKRHSIALFLNKAAHQPECREILEDEAKTLTDIRNKFSIRHSERNQIQIIESAHQDYLFHRLFSLMQLLLLKQASRCPLVKLGTIRGERRMAKKVALINMKGGVGKSTLTVNLAWHFAAKVLWDKKVLVVDLDPQFNASQYLLGVTEYEKILQKNIPTVWDIFEQLTHTPGGKKPKPLDPDSVVYNVVTYYDGSRIDLIPSRLELAYSLRNPTQKEQLLPKFISKVEGNYDLILLDCAPTESLLTTAAYLSSNLILVPVKPEYLSSIGLPLLVRSLDEFADHYEDHQLELAGVVFNGAFDYAPEEVRSKKDVRALAKEKGWYVFKGEVPYSRSFPKGAREGKPIFRTSYARTSIAAKMGSFAHEFAERIEL